MYAFAVISGRCENFKHFRFFTRGILVIALTRVGIVIARNFLTISEERDSRVDYGWQLCFFQFSISCGSRDGITNIFRAIFMRLRGFNVIGLIRRVNFRASDAQVSRVRNFLWYVLWNDR